MKTLLKIIIGFVVFIALALGALVLLVPAETYKTKVLALLEEKTGRKVMIDGTVNLNVFPDIALKMEKVSVSNPAWAGGGEMVKVEALRAGVKLMPLLRKEVILNGITLVKPQILLVQKGNQKNWELEKTAAAPATKTETSKGAASNIALGTITIEHGDVVIKDLAKRTETAVNDMNISLSAKDMNGPLTFKGNLVVNKQKHDVDVHVDSLGKTQSAESGFKAAWKSGKTSASVNGDVNVTQSGGFTALDIKNATIRFNDWKFSGRMGAKVGGAVPYVVASLQTDSLDFGNEGSGAAPAGGAKGASDWSDAKIDLSALRTVNADMSLAINKLRFKQAVISPAKVVVALKDGALNAQLKQAGVYKGKADVVAKATAGGAYALDMNMSGIQAEPLLKDWANYDDLTGTISGALRVTASGASQRQIVSRLNGSGNFKVLNGVYKGRNVISIVRNVTGSIRKDSASNDNTTFTDLSATAQISNGIVSNKDLVLRSSIMGLSGEGTVNLPSRQINYLVKPILLTAADKGLAVPVRIKGSFSNPSWTPDASGLLKEALTNPTAVKDAVKNFKGNLKDKKEAVKNVKDLLGAFGR